MFNPLRNLFDFGPRRGEVFPSPVAPPPVRKPTVLVVCTGNTCRSPMAEAVIRSHWPVHTQSAGLAAHRDAPAADNAIKVAKLRGVDLTSHRSRPIDAVDFSTVDLVLTMTLDQLEAAQVIVPVRIPIRALDVADPFGGSFPRYKATALTIEAQVAPFLDDLTGVSR